MTTQTCTFKTTPSPLTKNNLPLTLEDNVFLTYTMEFFQNLEKENASFYYYDTASKNADFKAFCSITQLTRIFPSGIPEVHSLGMSIRDKIQFLYPSEYAESETTRMNGTGFCLSQFQLKYIVALTKVVTKEIVRVTQARQFG